MLPKKNNGLIIKIIGSCLVVLGLIHAFFSEPIFNKIMEKEMVLRPNSKIFSLWKKPPIKLTLDFYFFNWTNPADFQNRDIKPKFEELGPYRFSEEPQKVDIKWHPENASITYKKSSKYYFDAAGSKGSLEDVITTLNSLAVSVSKKAKNWNVLRQYGVDLALNVYDNNMSIKKTVDELLFAGYHDYLLDAANILPATLTEVSVPFDRFGYCYPRNDSADVTGIFNVHTGADDIRKFGQIHTWNYRQHTQAYAPQCDQVYGSAGEFQSLYLQPNEPVHFFLSDACRTMRMDYVEETEVEGVKGFRYEGGKRMVDNGTLYPENVCHCNGQCVPSGVINISSCWYGAPMFLSYPHFYDADPTYLSAVAGLKPQKDKHEFYLVLEPKTGLMLDVTARFQSNVLVEPISAFSMFRSKRRIFFPLFWFDARTRITPNLAEDFKLLPRLILGARILGIISVFVGVVLIVWYPIKTHFQQRLIQQIKINNLDNESDCIVGKTISMQHEISPLLITAVHDNVKILERADTTLSDFSIEASERSADCSSMQSTASSSIHNRLYMVRPRRQTEKVATRCQHMHSQNHPSCQITLSTTRWEPHSNATNAVYDSFDIILEAPEIIAYDKSQNTDTRYEATCIVNKMQKFEFGLMLILWSSILTAMRSTFTKKTIIEQQQQFAAKMSPKCAHFIWRLSVAALGALIFTGGVYMFAHWIDIFTRMRVQEIALSPTSPAYQDWKVSPIPLNFDVYLFNWTNPEDFYVGSHKKPHFKEIGPYRFRENPDKVNIEWHESNNSVSYRKISLFFFDEANSKGHLSDRITSVNAVAHGAALEGKNSSAFGKVMLRNVLKMYREDVSVTKSANEWMFKGYRDPLVTMASLASKLSPTFEVPFDRVGYLYTRNSSSTFDGHFNVYTGLDDLRKIGQIHAWNHKTHNGVYEGECGHVRGSTGEFFPSNLTPQDTLEIYLQNLCRTVPLDYIETVKIHGVTAFKYAATERAVDNGTLYLEMKCYCVNGVCEKSGVVNLSPCQHNTPIYTSYPHFYKADPSYLEAIEGLSPDPAKHEFFMTLEPNSGMPMDVGGGFQVNYLLTPVPGIAPFDNIPRTFMPLMWAEERVRVPPEIASQIALVPLIICLGQVFTGIMFAVGIILICWYPTKCLSQVCRDPKSKNALLNPIVNGDSRSIALVPLRMPQIEGVSLIVHNQANSEKNVVLKVSGEASESLLRATAINTSNKEKAVIKR
ncbi:uncharacterized protein [Eurosta solidaginis]|uniref:uncharacterized protein n=1 Tax=Eurosta solidaginis TaxID=178769 RepID=UPI003530F713